MSIKEISHTASSVILATMMVAGAGRIDDAHGGEFYDRPTAGASQAIREAWIRHAIGRILAGDAIATDRPVVIKHQR